MVLIYFIYIYLYHMVSHGDTHPCREVLNKDNLIKDESHSAVLLIINKG